MITGAKHNNEINRRCIYSTYILERRKASWGEPKQVVAESEYEQKLVLIPIRQRVVVWGQIQ